MNDHPPSSYVGPIHEFRITGRSNIKGMPDYDYTFRSPDRSEAARNAYETASLPQFTSVLDDITIQERTVQYPHWKRMDADDLLAVYDADSPVLLAKRVREDVSEVHPR